MAPVTSQFRVIRFLLNLAATLDKKRQQLVLIRQNPKMQKPENRHMVKQLDENLKHIQSATIHLRHAADFIRKLQI